MKIGINGFDEKSGKRKFSRFGDKAFEKMREYGFEALDLGLADTETEYYTLPEEEAVARVLAIKERVTEAGMEICQVHGPWIWPPNETTPEGRAERLEKMKRSVSLTSRLGVTNWVVHPIMPFGIDDIGTGNETATWDLNMEFMTELLAHAKKCGVVICLENMPMPNFSLGAPKDILRFVEAINDESFRICLDTGHVTVFPELNIYEETKRLGSYIRCLHVHDNNQERDLHLFPRFGRTDWEGFMKALSEIGYDGVFSLETAPPQSLNDELFEDSASILYRIAKGLVELL